LVWCFAGGGSGNEPDLTAFDGTLLVGEGRRHSEWPIHGEIMQRRPDVNYTAHSHPFYGAIYSSVHEPLR